MVLLRAGMAEPDQFCERLPLMPEAERKKLLRDWNQTSAEYPKDKTVLDLYTAQVLANPEAPAIRFQDTTLTYQDLLQRAETLAAALERLGLEAGDRVGILLERSPDMVAALLAAWPIRALYVPLDPGFPSKRLAYVLEDADVQAMIASRAQASRVPDRLPGKSVIVDDLPTGSTSPVIPASSSGPGTTADVIYTT